MKLKLKLAKTNHDKVKKLIALARPLVIGHRGFCGIAPENTLRSFELGLEAGADLIELDYQHSKDGVPMVIHDATLNRTTDARAKWGRSGIRVSEKTAAEIQTLDAGLWFGQEFAGIRVPLLYEALDFICSKGGLPLIERKSGDAVTLAKLLRAKRLINRVVVISFDWEFLKDFHELEPAQIIGVLGPPIRLSDGGKTSLHSGKLNRKLAEEAAELGAKVVVWNRRISKALVETARKAGMKAWVYTINSPAEAKGLMTRGASGIITNNPKKIRQMFPALIELY